MTWFAFIYQTTFGNQWSWVILFVTDEGDSFPEPQNKNAYWNCENCMTFGGEEQFKNKLHLPSVHQKDTKTGTSTQNVHTRLAHLRMKKKKKQKPLHTHTLQWESMTHKQLLRLSPFSSAFSFQTAPPSGPLSPCPWIGPAAWHVSCKHKKRERNTQV